MLVVLLIQTPFRDEALPFSIDSAVEDASHRDFLGQVAGGLSLVQAVEEKAFHIVGGSQQGEPDFGASCIGCLG